MDKEIILKVKGLERKKSFYFFSNSTNAKQAVQNLNYTFSKVIELEKVAGHYERILEQYRERASQLMAELLE